MIKPLFVNKPQKVHVLVTFCDGSTETAWVTYSGWFDAHKFAEQLFEEFPLIDKMKVLDFK